MEWMKKTKGTYNKFLYRFKWKYGKYLNLKKPVCVDLELSSHCNLRCPFCYHAENEVPFKKGMMDYKTAKRILQQAHKLKVPSLKFNFRGESTLNKDFYHITLLAKMQAKGYTFQDRIVNTNLVNVYDSNYKLDGLLNCTTIKVSLDSLNIETYKKIRIGGDFQQVITSLNYLHKRITDQRLILQFVRTEENKKENFNRAKLLWPKAEIVVKDLVGGRNKDNAMPKGERQCCIQPFVRLITLFNGDMIMCCPDFKAQCVLGNIKTMTLYDAFNSAQASLLRDNLKCGLAFNYYNMCKNCSSWESYKGWKGSWKS